MWRRAEGLSAASPAAPVTVEIADMGYGVPELRREGGSYYRMADGTGSILRIAIRLHVLLPGERPGEFSVNANIEMSVFTPKGSRRPDLFRPEPQDPQSLVIDEDVGHDTLVDEPNVYSVGGATISVRPAIAQIKRTSLYTKGGEPLYLVNALPMFKVVNDAHGAARQAGPADRVLPEGDGP